MCLEGGCNDTMLRYPIKFEYPISELLNCLSARRRLMNKINLSFFSLLNIISDEATIELPLTKYYPKPPLQISSKMIKFGELIPTILICEAYLLVVPTITILSLECCINLPFFDPMVGTLYESIKLEK